MIKHSINISRGTYSLIKQVKGKNTDTLYFGYDNNNKMLSGIFLGDYELTSSIKNIQVITNNEGDKSIEISFTNDVGNLLTVTTPLISETFLSQISDLYNNIIPNIENNISILNTSNNIQDISINNAIENINSINNINNILDISINNLSTNITNILSKITWVDLDKINL